MIGCDLTPFNALAAPTHDVIEGRRGGKESGGRGGQASSYIEAMIVNISSFSLRGGVCPREGGGQYESTYAIFDAEGICNSVPRYG